MSASEDRDALVEQVKRLAVVHGEVTLASGRTAAAPPSTVAVA